MTEKLKDNPIHPNEKPLESWKEIAGHLQRDVRTVRRWEKDEGLPVHRYLHQARSSVYAYPRELDLWKIDREPRLNAPLLVTPWRRATAAVGFALALLLALATVASGPILTPTQASAQQFEGIVNRQVWAGPDADSTGEVSPDGRFLSYVNWVTGDLAVRDLASGEFRMLTNKGGWEKSGDFALNPRWSPDGKLIAYAWLIMPYEENPPETWELRITDLSGKKTRVLHRSTEKFVFPAGWFPDGKSILAITNAGDRVLEPVREIVRTSVEDGTISVLKKVDWPSNPGRVCLSPDGKYVAFEFPSDPSSMNSDVFVLPVEGGGETPLVTGPYDDRLLAWTPDGRSLLFASNRSSTYDVWLLRVENGKAAGAPELLKQDFGVVGAIGFSPDGKFYYGRDVVIHDIFVADFDAEAGKPVSAPKKASEHFAGATSRPAWSPDGKKLAYVVHRGPLYRWVNNQIRIRDLESGQERTLPKVTRVVRSLCWSPDGTSLLVCGVPEAHRRVCQIVDANSGTVVRDVAVRRGHGSPTSAAWAPDGSAVYYTTWVTNEGRGRIVRRNLRTGEEKVLYSLDRLHNPIYFAVSPDGKHLAFSLTGLSGEDKWVPSSIVVIPTAGGEEREIVRVELSNRLAENTLAWSPDSRHVFFAQTAGDMKTTKLYRVTLSGGEPEYLEFETKVFGGLRLRPDGRQIAFTLFSKGHGEVWVMENFLPALKASK